MRPFTVLLFVFLAVFGPAAWLTAGAAHAPVVRVAPADEYFGRLKMSILGIRNQLRDLALRLRYSPQKSEDVIGSAAMVEDAMRDWEHKYPADPWLAKSVYDLMELYARVHTPHGHAKATHALKWLLARYGRTHYGHLARLQTQRRVVAYPAPSRITVKRK